MFTLYQYAKCKIWNLLFCFKYGLYSFNCFNHSTYLYQTMNDNVRRVLTTLKVNVWEYFNSFIFINHTLILFSANIQTLSKTTALTFLKNIHHRTKRDDDLNISEECMEDTCVYEEVREFINYKKLDLTVASYLNILFCFGFFKNKKFIS